MLLHRVRYWVGYVLGAPVGLTYELILRVRNAGSAQVHVQRINGRLVKAYIKRECKWLPKIKGKTVGAITLGRVFCRDKFPSPRLIRHELEHVEQQGSNVLTRAKFYTEYGAQLATVGYENISFEQKAREASGV